MSHSQFDRIALSTCWCSHRHTDGLAMMEEIRELGFARVELGHGVPVSLVPGVLRAVDEGLVEVGSVHNFCPLPVEADRAAPNFFQPSAKPGKERRAWLRQSLQTLELAKRVGASHVVMHSGSVFFRFRSPAGALASGSDADEGAREKALVRLRKRSRTALDRVADRFRDLLEYAGPSAPHLAVENREGILELPLDEDLSGFLGRFEAPTVAYWHDTGHAEIKRRLGLLDPLVLLGALSDRIAGFHLHDVDEAGRDHQAIGAGTVDFRALAPFVRPETHLVLELHPRVGCEEVRDSRERLREWFS
jgi:sugar phosphate isomerase/epimerase